ncbi:GNAT family N-acetyltransferase [Ekhidna sp.]|jgi:L-amino acid N-acyltransferase YncA|uniref:GNAT family N-acetyltransferase n=1 Tax=Ekhidna sp. TaxID=2608089 RepID=UPI0032EC4FC2
MIEIRKATEMDNDGVWKIFSEVVKKGDTYVFPDDTPKADLRKYWFTPEMETYVAESENGEIVGTYFLKPNYPGRGNHIANAGYMVKPSQQGKGIGKQLCEHSMQIAEDLGYIAMQFNIVVSTNTAAVRLWQKFDFEIIGTTPNGFQHKELGLVDTYVMWRGLK